MDKVLSSIPLVLALLTPILVSSCATGSPVPTLHKLILEGDTEGARKLIERRQDVNTLSESGYTPMHLAVGRDHQVLVELLLNAGASLDTRTNAGETALVIACRLKSSTIAKLLVERGAQINPAYPGTNAISEAIRSNHLDLIALFINRGANLEVKNHFGETPIFYAVHFGNEATVLMLIKNGANINAVSNDGRTVLHVAAMKRDQAAIDSLLRLGVESREADGSEVALYSTAQLYSMLGRSALMGGQTSTGLDNMRKSARYYSESARKFEHVAANHQASAERVQSANVFSVAFAGIAAFGQAHSQASSMAQVTPRGQTATGYGFATYVQRDPAQLQALAAKYRALAETSKSENTQLLSLISCIETQKGTIQTCRGASR